MPQPLSKVAPHALVCIGSNTDSPSENRPELALLAMRVIAEWSILEGFLSLLFVKMLGANPGPGAAMYAALKGAATQRAAFNALADMALRSDAEKEVLRAIMALFRTAALERSKIAHWVWGHSPEIPDGVLLGEPKAFAKFNVAQEQFTTELMAGGRPKMPEVPRDRIFVYLASDFIKESERLQRLMDFVASFTFVLNRDHPVNRGDEEFQRLSLEPEIQEVLVRLRNNPKTDEEAPL